MTAIDLQTFQDQSDAAFAAVQAALGTAPVEFATAGELATLLTALPPDTPITIAETVRIDPNHRLGEDPNRTAAIATVKVLVDAEQMVDVLDDGEIHRYARPVPGVELTAVIVSADAPVPAVTVPFPPQERAIEALDDLDVVLDAHIELLAWMAGTLTHTIDPDGEEAAGRWPGDRDIRERLAVEASRLSQAAARLTILRTRVAAYEAAEITETAADDPEQP